MTWSDLFIEPSQPLFVKTSSFVLRDDLDEELPTVWIHRSPLHRAVFGNPWLSTSKHLQRLKITTAVTWNWWPTCASTQLGVFFERSRGTSTCQQEDETWDIETLKKFPTCNMSDLWDIVQRSRLGAVLAVPSLWGPWIEMLRGFGRFERFLVRFWENVQIQKK